MSWEEKRKRIGRESELKNEMKAVQAARLCSMGNLFGPCTFAQRSQDSVCVRKSIAFCDCIG